MNELGEDEPVRRYSVRHRTEYSYDLEVTASYGRAHLIPRDVPGQQCHDVDLRIRPEPHLLTERQDFFGNRCSYFEIHRPHTRLAVTVTSTVEVTRQVPDLSRVQTWAWEQARDAVRGALSGRERGWPGWSRAELVAVGDLLLPSPQVQLSEEVRAWAAAVFTPGRSIAEAVVDLVHRIHAELRYAPGTTGVTTTLPEVLARGSGVCQDFAHLAVGALRVAGVPARYVSGYLETVPPPGRPRLEGADASHAWAAALLPALGWVDLDPTNDRLADASYVVTAWGRDYTDIPPLKGVIFSEGRSSSLRVAVDVVRS